MNCASCSAANLADSAFCDQCGQPLPNSVPAPTPSIPTQTLERSPAEQKAYVDFLMKRDSKIGQSFFKKIPRPVRIGLLMGSIVGVMGSFFLLMAAPGLLSAYIFLGPMAAAIVAVLGAALGSLVSSDGSKQVSRAMFQQCAGLLVLFGGLCIGAFFLIRGTLHSIGGINCP